jgi:DNA-binding SARP family transcriptional activator
MVSEPHLGPLEFVLQHRMGRRDAAHELYRNLARELEERCDRAPSEETEALVESLEAVPQVVRQ